MIVVSVVVLAAIAVGADDPQVGTWKLNEAKSDKTMLSHIARLVKVEAQDNGLKIIMDSVNGQDKPIHGEYVTKYDGNDYPRSEPSYTTALKRIDSHTIEQVNKKDGKVVETNRWTISLDGKTRTYTSIEKDGQGKIVTHSAVFDKQ